MRIKRPGFLSGANFMQPRGLGQTAQELQAQIAKLEQEAGAIQTVTPPVMMAPSTSYMAPVPQFKVLPQPPRELTTEEKVAKLVEEYQESKGDSPVIRAPRKMIKKQIYSNQSNQSLLARISSFLFG